MGASLLAASRTRCVRCRAGARSAPPVRSCALRAVSSDRPMPPQTHPPRQPASLFRAESAPRARASVGATASCRSAASPSQCTRGGHDLPREAAALPTPGRCNASTWASVRRARDAYRERRPPPRRRCPQRPRRPQRLRSPHFHHRSRVRRPAQTRTFSFGKICSPSRDGRVERFSERLSFEF